MATKKKASKKKSTKAPSAAQLAARAKAADRMRRVAANRKTGESMADAMKRLSK
jgi:hypothetical protein